MKNENYELMNVENGRHVKMWTQGVPVEAEARKQLESIARMPFIFKHVAVMPDVHLGKGSTIGSVIPTKGAIIPAAVGVDIGCGMMACKTTLAASDLPDNLGALRAAIETAVPHGMSPRKHGRDKGSWETPPSQVDAYWAELAPGFERITQKNPRLKNTNNYVEAVGWAQHFARLNREAMMQAVVAAARSIIAKPFETHVEAVNCHHNYVQEETHFGERVLVTRKGAVRAGLGELGIIPGSMGARSFIVRGKGNAEAFESCSHGAGRAMSRSEAKRRYTVADQVAATAGVECRKDADVIDEIPLAYKDIDAVTHAQRDLVEVVHRLKQVVCVKG
jgi:RNA-splicing ligase RtcB